MATLDSPTPSVPLPDAPFVGMRPFEREEQAILFGRTRDAVLLGDKVLSGKLTVFFGLSGSGKSSLLRALLVPYLEEQNSLVIYFDHWSGDDPIADLRARLIEAAIALNIPDPGAGAPSLTDLVQLLASADDRTVVLVLDQFEEFFTHGHRPAPLRHELGALVRMPNLDVKLLLSLREEHLAALEPFRVEIPNLFQSTYRLELLNEESVRQAITGPLELFQADYETELVDDLIIDLRPRDQRPAEAGQYPPSGDTPADLPMLQLVCDELWKEAAKRRQATDSEQPEEQQPVKLSRDLYQNLGERKGILETYLYRVMPERWHWRQRLITARLMKYLAPTEGYKVALSSDYLAELIRTPLTRTPRSKVKKELERLSTSEVRVLRSRSHEGGQVRYELYHDRFIPIISPWRDQVLRNFKRVCAAGILMLVIIGIFVGDWWVLHRNTEGVLRDIPFNLMIANSENFSTRDKEVVEKLNGRKFDQVANYLIWTRTWYHPFNIIKSRFDTLKDKFTKYQAGLPKYYGIEISGVEFITLPMEGEEWPLTVSYSSSRNLNEPIFTQMWQLISTTLLNERWGIPVPLKLKLVKKDIAKDQIELTGPHIKEPVYFTIQAHEDKAYLRFNPKNLMGQARTFFEKFRDDWIEINPEETKGEEAGESIWVVPRWSLPAWKNLGETIYDGSALPAYILAYRLVSRLKLLMTPDAMEILFAKVAKQYPDTVAEARAVRRDRLVEDVQEIIYEMIVRDRDLLNQLPTILDALANYPEKSSQEIADGVAAEIDSFQVSLRPGLRGPHKTTPQPPEAKFPQAYGEAANWLPKFKSEVRVYHGVDLRSRWFTEQGDFRPEVHTRLKKIQDNVFKRFGVPMPPGELIMLSELTGNTLCVELMNQTKKHSHAGTFQVDQEKALDQLAAALTFRLDSYRIHFLNAEQVRDILNDLNPAVRSWLLSRYSLTDLKLLLRAVINPSPEELKHREKIFAEGVLAQTHGIPEGSTIRQPGWLLASLVFWSQVDSYLSIQDMAADLRKTQSARLDPRKAPPPGEVAKLLLKGVKSLDQGQVEEAEKVFSEAIQSDPKSAVSGFLALYPQEFQRQLVQTHKALFAGLLAPSQELEQLRKLLFRDLKLAELEAKFDEKFVNLVLDQEVDPQIRRRIMMLLLGIKEFTLDQWLDLVDICLEQFGSPLKWPADETAFFGTLLLLRQHQFLDLPGSTGQKFTKLGLVFLKFAQRRVDHQDTFRQTSKVLKIYKRPGNLELSRSERIELEDLVDQEGFDNETARWLRLCLLAAYPESYRQDKRTLADKIVKLHGTPDQWSAEEAAWFAIRLLADFDPLTDNPTIPQTGMDFLTRALPQLSEEKVKDQSFKILTICRTKGPNQWCWNLLPDLAESRQDPYLHLDIGLSLSEREVPADLEYARILAELAKKEINSLNLPPPQKNLLIDYADFLWASATFRLAVSGAEVDREKREKAEGIFSRLLENKGALGIDSHVSLARLRLMADRPHEAAVIIDQAIQKWPEESGPYGVKLSMLLAAENQKDAANVALEAWNKVKRENGKITSETSGLAFVSALGLLMTQTEPWERVARDFLQTDHPYVPYIAMLLYARLTGKNKEEALKVIQLHWARVQPETWEARLKQRDQTVWREMLIGYYLKKEAVPHKRIFGPLEDDQHFKDSELSGVPMPRKGMLCEAYFYDALFAEAQGNRSRMKSSLQKAVDSNYQHYFEHSMAKFLLANLDQKQK